MKIIVTERELNWFITHKLNWIEVVTDTELSTTDNKYLYLKRFVLPTELFDAGREFQSFINKLANENN